MKKKTEKITAILAVVMMCIILFAVFIFSDDKELQKEVVEQITDTVTEMATYEMTEEEINALGTTEIIEQTAEQENAQEQEVESESFKLQGNIAYEGDKATTWNVELGDYKGLTYYSQIDSRWRNKMYSSIGDSSQTIGTSGCGPTSASMIVTACKGAITPDTMADLFVKYGYRSANDGTYWSAFRAIADEFNIGYEETSDIQRALQLLQSKRYVVASVGNGLFTTGGHFIVLVGIEGDNIKVYDPYLYAGKFETSTRRGKAVVNGNTVYVSIDNFKKYANAKGFFCYAHDENTEENNSQPVVTQSYTRYVNAKIGLNVRSEPNGKIIGALAYGSKVTVKETNGNWSKITSPVGWVSSEYLVSSLNTPVQVPNTVGSIKKLSRACILYSNSNLTGIKYSYKANTTIQILQNISNTIDKIKVNATGRIAYIDNSNYKNSTINKNTVGQVKRLKACTLFSNSNLSGIRYSYKNNTSVVILENINSYIDKIRVRQTGRIAYVNIGNYK